MDNEADDREITPGFYELAQAESLLEALQRMKESHGRLWAIAVTDAEKLVAWISYAVSTFDDTEN